MDIERPDCDGLQRHRARICWLLSGPRYSSHQSTQSTGFERCCLQHHCTLKEINGAEQCLYEALHACGLIYTQLLQGCRIYQLTLLPLPERLMFRTIRILSVCKRCGYAFVKPHNGVLTTLPPWLYRSLEFPAGHCQKNNYSACARARGVTVPPCLYQNSPLLVHRVWLREQANYPS